MVYQFDDLLDEIGSYKLYQKRLIWMFLAPGCFTLPFFIMNNLFLLGVPDHWCYQPGKENFNLTEEEWKMITIPREKDGFSKCEMYDMQNILYQKGLTEVYLLELNHDARQIPVIDCKNGWTYSKTYYKETVPSYFDWVCGNADYVPYAFTLNTLGNVVGASILSPLADGIGRKNIFFLTAFIQFAFGLAMSYPPTQSAFLTLLFIKSLAFPACFQAAYIQVLEFMGPEKRGFVNMVLNLLWTVGMAILALLAFICSGYWKTFNLVTSIIGLYLLGYWWFVKESPRWLTAKGKYKQAISILEHMSKVNKTYPIKDLEEKVEDLEQADQKSLKGTLVIFTYKKQIFRVCITTVGWTAVLILYYGIHLNLGGMAGSPYLNQFLLGVIEAPSYVTAFFLMESIGRRWTEALLLLVGGLSYLLIAAVPLHLNWLILTLSIIGKFGVSGAFMVVYMHAPEIFPTPVRSSAVGIPAIISNAVNLAVPYIIFLGQTVYAAPFLVLGGMNLLAAPLVLFLPETLKHNLPQNLEDAQEFGKDQKYFSLNRVKKIKPQWSSRRRSTFAEKDVDA